MQILIYILLGSLIGMGVVYLVLRPKLKTTQKLNEKIALENKKLEEANDNLRISKVGLDSEIAQLTNKRSDINAEIERVNNTLVSARQQAETAATLVYEKTMETMQEQLSNAAEQESKKFNEAKNR